MNERTPEGVDWSEDGLRDSLFTLFPFRSVTFFEAVRMPIKNLISNHCFAKLPTLSASKHQSIESSSNRPFRR